MKALSRRIVRYIAVVTLALTGLTVVGVSQAMTPSEFRTTFASKKFSGTFQAAAIFDAAAPVWLRANRLEYGIGGIANSEDTRPFVSVGPVWKFQPFQHNPLTRNVYTEFGFSPTLVAGSGLGDRDLGGNLHFTSSVTLGLNLGKSERSRIAVRAQHISNGGLNETNPGLDTFGLRFELDLPRR